MKTVSYGAGSKGNVVILRTSGEPARRRQGCPIEDSGPAGKDLNLQMVQADDRRSDAYFNSVFSKFASRAPANATRRFANFAAAVLYCGVNVNGPSPAAIGAL